MSGQTLNPTIHAPLATHTSPQAAVTGKFVAFNHRCHNLGFSNQSNQQIVVTFQGCSLSDFSSRVKDLPAGTTLAIPAGQEGYAILSDPWAWLRYTITPAAPATGPVIVDLASK